MGANPGKTLSGVKRHRRHNTIANGDCYSGHRSTSQNSPGNEQAFDISFLNSINLSTNHPNDELTNIQTSVGSTNLDLNFDGFASTFEIPNLPIQQNVTSQMKGRHRRSKLPAT
jgi:hypothetical protein